MQRTQHSQRGFTLVEIMIVVVIIGLLAGIAIPAWQKTRIDTVRTVMDNDARNLARAAQQYFCEFAVDSVDYAYAVDGVVTGSLSLYVTQISKNYVPASGNLTVAAPFTMEHPQLGLPRQYNVEGRYQP